MLSATLTTSDTLVTPALQQWGIGYLRGPVPLSNIAFTLRGGKTIGSTGGGLPIYKTTIATSTGASGSNPLTLEWDAYTLSLAGYDTVDVCNAPPYTLSPGVTAESSLYVTSATSNSVLISVRDSANVAIPGATVTLSRPGYSSTVQTSACGGAYFGGITAASTYTVTVSKSGYTTDTTPNVDLSGHTFYAVSL